ncbi:unnamed protein product, partial [Closterium sp. NIES-54]
MRSLRLPTCRPCCPVASPLLSRHVALSRRVVSVPSHRIRHTCSSRRAAPSVPSRPAASRCPSASRCSFRPAASRLPVLSDRVALPIPSRRATPAHSVAPFYDLLKPNDPAPLGADPSSADRDRYARQCADLTAWKSRDAAAYIALSNLLPESEEAHFTQVRTASEFLTAIKARYATPTMLDSGYRAACTDTQLALLPPPMVITIYFIATSLPDRLASVRDALILKHPSELTIEVLDSALKDVESNLQSVASTSRDVPPPLFHGCTVPQLPTFTASLATSAADVTAAAVRGRSGRRGSLGVGGGGGGSRGGVASGGDGSTEVGGATRAAASDSPTAAGGGDTRV